MKMAWSLLSVILIQTVYSCNNSDGEKKTGAFHVDFDNCKTNVNLKLSDLIEDCWLIPLETTQNSVLGRFINVINLTGEYIIIADENGVYKFSKEGNFINKILKRGRGPGEISGSCRYFYDKKDNVLFIEDGIAGNDFISRYDLNSEKYLPSIKKCFTGPWYDFVLYQDTLIMGSVQGLSRGDTNPYAVFIQNFEGTLIDGIKSNKTFKITRNDLNDVALQRFFIITGDKSIHFVYNQDDTIFSLKNDNSLSVYLIPEYKNKTNVPSIMPNEGYTLTFYDNYENPSFMILDHSVFKGWIPRANYLKTYYIMNKSNGNFSMIQSYQDNLTGKKFNLGKSVPITPGIDKEFPAPSSSPDGLLYVMYYPNELSPVDMKNNSVKNMVVNLEKIKNLKETDNPVLLIGKPKKRLQILN
jgi:hypothetical protein